MRYEPGRAGYLTSVDLDEVAGRLYALPPPEFTAAREAEARAAKEAGDVRLAREITRLRKPTVSAWAVNKAAREHPGALGELLELGEELRRAWREQDAGALAELTRRRGAVSGRVGRLVTEGAGLSAAAATEVDQTLDAAVVDADAAAQVRAGRLVRPLSYSGFAPAPEPAARAGSARSGAGQARASGTRASGTRASEVKESGAEQSGAVAAVAAGVKGSAAARRRAKVEDETARARARQEAEERRASQRQEAEAVHREWQEALAVAVQEHEERAGKVARLEQKLAKARRRLAESEQRLEVARREERHARHRLEG
ncbi:hypothetical protein AB0C18_30405 [Nonomuraea muscovyensis]|uniref:hypothetical protein n=1 Tax=Nonomuraea muscovyensis TaxID=1124761 RepID=UPI0033D51FCA